MSSKSLETWQTIRANALNEIVTAHRMVGGIGPGRRVATQQINHAYAMLLSSQFQGYCRDLHSESVDCLVGSISPANLRGLLSIEFLAFRKLDRGNPNPGNIGADFGRLELSLWSELVRVDARTAANKRDLELLNEWRNAIAHQDFDPTKLGAIRSLHLSHVQQWRKACDALANSLDEVVRQHLTAKLGTSPW